MVFILSRWDLNHIRFENDWLTDAMTGHTYDIHCMDILDALILPKRFKLDTKQSTSKLTRKNRKILKFFMWHWYVMYTAYTFYVRAYQTVASAGACSTPQVAKLHENFWVKIGLRGAPFEMSSFESESVLVFRVDFGPLPRIEILRTPLIAYIMNQTQLRCHQTQKWFNCEHLYVNIWFDFFFFRLYSRSRKWRKKKNKIKNSQHIFNQVKF